MTCRYVTSEERQDAWRFAGDCDVTAREIVTWRYVTAKRGKMRGDSPKIVTSQRREIVTWRYVTAKRGKVRGEAGTTGPSALWGALSQRTRAANHPTAVSARRH